MIREREGSKGIRFFIAFFFIAIFFFAVGFIANRWFFAKDANKTVPLLSEKEAALRKIDSNKKGDDARKKNPLVGEEKEDFTFYKTLQNGKEHLPLKQQKKEEKEQKAENSGHKKEEKQQKTEEKSQKTEKTESNVQKKEDKKESTEQKSKKIEEKKHKAIDKANKSEVKSQESKARNRKTASVKEKRFALQIAAFKEKDKAEDVAGSLKKKGYEPYIVPVTIPEKGVWYRVRIGRFATRPDAQNMQSKLKKSIGIDSIITFTTE